jgi:hypothetical protein
LTLSVHHIGLVVAVADAVVRFAEPTFQGQFGQAAGDQHQGTFWVNDF